MQLITLSYECIICDAFVKLFLKVTTLLSTRYFLWLDCQIMHTKHNFCFFMFLCVFNRYSHGWLQTRELGQTSLCYHGWLTCWPALIWTLNLVQIVLEPVCCKKQQQQKKNVLDQLLVCGIWPWDQALKDLNDFKLIVYETKWFPYHPGSILYHSESSEVPYSTNQ